MEDPGSRTDRIGKGQRRVMVERRFEMERVERTLLAKAYESAWPAMAGDAGGRADATRGAGNDSLASGLVQCCTRRRGRCGSGTLMAVGG
jgi:hypothetical protein